MGIDQIDEPDSNARKLLVGQRLRQERKQRGWSQKTLADQLDTGVLNINRWEHGKTMPQPYYREKLSHIFGKSIAELFGEEEKSQPPQLLSMPISQPIFQERVPVGDQNRLRMLEKVSTIWIKGLLEKSLQEAAFLQPSFNESPDSVTHPWKLTLQDFKHPDRPLPPDRTIERVYADAGQELLLLGEPGSGKTLLLLDLARILLERARFDESLPMPVIFNLSSWAQRRQPLVKWLVEELTTKYQVPHKLAQDWVEQGQIQPLLDGLDEVAPQQRESCIHAINLYRQQYGMVPLVVCSRSRDYTTLSTRLHLQNAVIIQPLTFEQIDSYLAQAGEALEPVRQALRDDKELCELASTPLMLRVFIVAYRGNPINELLVEGSVETRRQRVFQAYIQQVLQRRGNTQYSPQQTLKYLKWLARQLASFEQSEFYIEHMQMNWLPKSPWRWLFPAFVVGLVYALFIGTIKGASYMIARGADQHGRPFTAGRGLLDGIVIGLVNLLVFTLLNGLLFGILQMRVQTWTENQPQRAQKWQTFLNILGSWPVYGLLNGVLNGLVIGYLVDVPAGLYNGLFISLIYAGLGKLDPQIRPAEVLTWSWEPVRQGIVRYAGGGMLVGIAYGLFTGLYWQTKTLPHLLSPSRFLPCLLFGFSIGIIIGLLVLLTRGLSHTRLVQSTIPNQGIHNSARNSLLLAIIAWIFIGLFLGTIYGIVQQQIFHIFAVPYPEYKGFFPQESGLGIGFTYGFVVGAFFWLRSGGTACIQHLLLRLFLFQQGAIPWNYPKFLNEASERIVLRKVGGGYIFVHRLLRDYFQTLE